MKTLHWLMVIGLALACVSCAKKKHPDPSLWEVKDPAAKVLSLRVTQQTDTGFRVVATVELTNDNRVPLPLIDTRYHIHIDKVGSISLVDKARRTLPANGRQTLELPASFAWNGPAPAGAAWNVQGTVSYHPPGELRQIMTDSNIPLPRSDFQETGSLQ